MKLDARLTALAVLSLVFLANAALGATIWREGEDTMARSVTRHRWWYDKVKTDMLSGGDFISHWSEDAPGTVAYDLQVPESGDYTFWVRANPAATTLSYRVDAEDWTEIDFSDAEQKENIAADDQIDLRFISWVRVGQIHLDEGQHTVRFKFHSENNHHGSLDCFVLTTEGFTPHGIARPADIAEAGEPVAPEPLLTDANAWAFDPPRDEFTDEALLDLSHLNEDEAGETGFIRLSEDGGGFVKGNGEPIRFWSAVSGITGMEPDQMEQHCRFLAKLGVNMIRIHGRIADDSKGAQITDVRQSAVDSIQRAVAIAKKHGIYVTISPYWYHHRMPASWDLAGYEAGDMPTGSMFFNEKFQDAYKTWVRELYTSENPYTGIPLKDDPAVGIIQVKNEDSLLFYTFDRIPVEQKRILGKMFGDWLKEKYGSLEATREAWKGARLDKANRPEMIDDDWENGIVGFNITWQMTQEHSGGMARRINDQLQFLAKTQRGFYEEIDRYYREELGCRQITNAMNWKSADKLTTDDAERWTYLACDVVAVNRYCGGVHVGQNRGYRIDPGHYLINRSLLRNPLQMPTNLKQPVGHPFIITESAWVHPNLYQTEGPLMAAAYMGLNGVDSLYWFHLGEPTWMRDPRRKFWRVVPGDTGYAIHKWTGSVPQQVGMFPANALIHRLGYVRRGETVVHEERTLDEIWRREHPIIAETETFDPNRDTQDLRGQTGGDMQVSRLAFLVGPAEVRFEGNPAETEVADLSRYIDGAAKKVRSNTGEIELDYGVGVLKVETPKACGVAGFLKEAGGTFEVGDVTIESDNDYATIEAVAMDDRPLAESEKVLLQIGTVARLTGWVTQDDSFEQGGEIVKGKRIVYTGKPPWLIADTKATVSIENPGLSRATLLDEAGYPERDLDVEREGGRLRVELPADAMYVLLR